jgi:methionine aminotransferase
MVAPAALSVELRKVHQYLTFCTFHAAQWALSDYMASGSQHHLELSAFYQAKRDYFAHGLKQSRFRLLPVQGAYFQLVDYSAISDKPDTEFASWLTESVGVAAIPVSAFYEQAPDSRIVRFCFAKQQNTLDAALEKLIAV